MKHFFEILFANYFVCVCLTRLVLVIRLLKIFSKSEVRSEQKIGFLTSMSLTNNCWSVKDRRRKRRCSRNGEAETKCRWSRANLLSSGLIASCSFRRTPRPGGEGITSRTMARTTSPSVLSLALFYLITSVNPIVFPETRYLQHPRLCQSPDNNPCFDLTAHCHTTRLLSATRDHHMDLASRGLHVPGGQDQEDGSTIAWTPSPSLFLS